MSELFLELLNMSIIASWIVLAILVLRLFLKKAPRWITCLLWAIVGLRLLLPFSIESVFSLLPSSEPIPEGLFEVDASSTLPSSGTQSVSHENSPYEVSYFEPPTVSDAFISSSEIVGIENPAIVPPKEGVLRRFLSVIAAIWAVGSVLMICYAVYSYFRIWKRVRLSIAVSKKIFFCDYIDTPFVLGVIRPRIYVPSALTDKESLAYVLAHEEAHLKRFDHLWKPLGYMLLTIYWFNPFIWLAYILLCRDIEIACDERVVKNMKATEKIRYTHTLLQYSIPRKMIAACPLAFGEVQIKERVKTVLRYKKPAFWIIVVAVIVCLVFSVGFLTNPKEEQNSYLEGDSGSSESISNESRSEQTSSDDVNDASQPDGESFDESDSDSDQTHIPNEEISAYFRSVEINAIGSVRDAAEETGCLYAETDVGIEIVKIDTCSQLNLFSEHLQEDAEGNPLSNHPSGILEELYDEQFFEENSLIVLITNEASDGNENYLNSVYLQGDTLKIDMKKVLGDTDGSKILLNCLEVRKEEVTHCTKFSVEMTMREDYPVKTVDIQRVDLSSEEVTAYLNYNNKELHTETFLLCLDRSEDVQSLRMQLDDASTLASALAVYDEAFFEENSLYLFYTEQASLDDDLGAAKYMTAYRYLVAGTFKPLTEELEIEIEYGKNLSSNSSPVPQLLLFGLKRNDWSAVSYTIKTEMLKEDGQQILNLQEERKELLLELLREAGDGAVLIGENGRKTVLDAEGVAGSLYQHADSFVETKEGHLYDGMIEIWVIYGDGTIFGMYSDPSENVPDTYASCAGRIYGAQYHIDQDDDIILAKMIYGFLPTEALGLPFELIGY